MRAAIALLVTLATLAAGETLDRVAVRVGSGAITASAVRRHLRMEAFFSGHAPELDVASRRKAAERLIDQNLIRRELDLNRFAPPAAADVEKVIAELLKTRQEDAAALARALEAYGFTSDDLRNEVQYRIMLQRFVDFRFSAGILVSEEEIREAYEKEVVPDAAKAGTPAPSAEDSRSAIINLLTYRKTTTAMEQWLTQARQQVKIRIFEEAFQ